MSDLINQNLILYDIPEERNYVLTNVLQNNISLVNSIQKVQLTEAIVELVSANLGISIMAKWAVAPFLDTKPLKIIPFNSDQGRRDWFIESLSEVSETESFFIEEIRRGGVNRNAKNDAVSWEVKD